jgi:hypothetical protein
MSGVAEDRKGEAGSGVELTLVCGASVTFPSASLAAAKVDANSSARQHPFIPHRVSSAALGTFVEPLQELEMTQLKIKSQITKSLVACACVAASMLFAMNGAAAATTQNAHGRYRAPAHVAANTVHPTTRHTPARTASRWTAPRGPYGYGVGQDAFSWLPPQYAQIIRNARSYQARGSTYSSAPESPTYSYAEPVDNSAASAASEQAAADSVTQSASMAATQAQNDAANAATVAGITGN